MDVFFYNTFHGNRTFSTTSSSINAETNLHLGACTTETVQGCGLNKERQSREGLSRCVNPLFQTMPFIDGGIERMPKLSFGGS